MGLSMEVKNAPWRNTGQFQLHISMHGQLSGDARAKGARLVLPVQVGARRIMVRSEKTRIDGQKTSVHVFIV